MLAIVISVMLAIVRFTPALLNRSMKISPKAQKILFALLVMVAFYGAMAVVLKAIGLENAQNSVKQAGIWAPVFFVLLSAASLIIAPLSGSSLFILGGALFGKGAAYLLSYLATLLGCSANFWISRKFGRRVAAWFIGRDELNALDKFTQRLGNRRGVVYITLLMPLGQDLVSYAVGLTKVRYRNFAIALAISSAFVVAAYIYLGTGLLERML